MESDINENEPEDDESGPENSASTENIETGTTGGLDDDPDKLDVQIGTRITVEQIGIGRLIALFASFLLALAMIHLLAIEIWHVAELFGSQVFLWIVAIVAFMVLARHIFLVQFKGHSTPLKIIELGAVSILGTFIAIGVHEAVDWTGSQMTTASHTETDHSNTTPSQAKSGTAESARHPISEDHADSNKQHDQTDSSNGKHGDQGEHSFSWLFFGLKMIFFVPLAAAALWWMERNTESLPERGLIEYKSQENGSFASDAPIVEHLIIPLSSPNWLPRFADNNSADEKDAHAFF